MEQKVNLLMVKAKSFALRVVKMCSFLRENCKEYVMSMQVFRSGTSIGANIAESLYAQSPSDFVHKLSISRKEGSETLYWIDLLYEAGYIDQSCYESMRNDCEELMKLLTSSIKTTIKNNNLT